MSESELLFKTHVNLQLQFCEFKDSGFQYWIIIIISICDLKSRPFKLNLKMDP